MSGITVTSVIDDAVQRYRDLTRSNALVYMQGVHDDFNRTIGLNRVDVNIALVQGQMQYPIPSNLLTTWGSQLRHDSNPRKDLTQVSVRKIDRKGYVHQGWPKQIFIQQGPVGTSRLFGLDPTPYSSSLVVSSATATTPIVVGFTQPHGLTTGTSLYLTDLEGITGADGLWPTVTVVDSYHVSLDTSVGGGAYTSGGIGATQTIPFLWVEYSIQDTLGEASNSTTLPDAVTDMFAYTAGIWKHHSFRRHTEDYVNNSAIFDAEKSRLQGYVTSQLKDVVPQAHPRLKRLIQMP